MLYEENNLLKLLEYGQMGLYDTYNAIAVILGLEFYNEPDKTVYSICSHSFVLDITGSSCTLIFVEDSFNSQFGFIQEYLNNYLSNNVVFYHLLKFFINIVDLDIIDYKNNKQITDNISGLNIIKGDLSEHKTMCSCIFSKKYCFKQKIPLLSSYNIFTHRIEHIHYNPLISLPAYETEGIAIPSDDRTYFLNENLSKYFTECEYSIQLIDKLPKSNLYYYEKGDIQVCGRNVLIDGIKCKMASFLFKKGLSLSNSLNYTRKIKQSRKV